MACQEASTITNICIRPSDDVCLNVCVDPCDDAGMFENSDGDSNGLDLSDNDTFLNLDVSCLISMFKCFKFCSNFSFLIYLTGEWL